MIIKTPVQASQLICCEGGDCFRTRPDLRAAGGGKNLLSSRKLNDDNCVG